MNVRTVLFLCTGNYYRSRFAEGLFNHLAWKLGLKWKADSRALALERGESVNVGPISPYTLDGFKQRSIAVVEPIRFPKRAALEDFSSAGLVIALKEAEHRPLMRARFPEWEDKITYWHIHDLDQSPHHLALAEIEELVTALVNRLAETELKLHGFAGR